MEKVESLGEVARNLNIVRNKQIEMFELIQTLEQRVEDLLMRFRPLEDRLVHLEKATSLRAPGYGR
jgi:archaellum component FlaC